MTVPAETDPVGGDDLHVIRQAGDGALPGVVVVHGGMDRSSSFGRVARQLPEVPLVRYDRRGYGRSTGLGVGSLDQHVDDLLAVLGDEPMAVFGHSVGGVVALVAAVRRPDLIPAVLVYEAPTPWVPWWPVPRDPTSNAASDDLDEAGAAGDVGDAAGAADEAERFMRRMVGDRIWERLPSRTRADRRAEGLALRADLAAMAPGRLAFDPTSVTVPVLCATGTDTSWWHRRGVEELASALPRGELAMVEGATHGVHLSHPGETAALVRRLRVLGGGSPSPAVVEVDGEPTA